MHTLRLELCRNDSSPSRTLAHFDTTNLEREETLVTKIIFCALSLLILLALKPTSQVFAGQALPVHIRQGGDVDNEEVNLSRSAGDEVVWSSAGDEFTISFQISPFAASSFHVPAGGSISSGPVRSNAALGHYQYFISDDSSGNGGDPGVNIK